MNKLLQWRKLLGDLRALSQEVKSFSERLLDTVTAAACSVYIYFFWLEPKPLPLGLGKLEVRTNKSQSLEN